MPLTSPPSTEILDQEVKETEQELSVHLPAPSKKKGTKKRTKGVKSKQNNGTGHLSRENNRTSTSSCKENKRISSPTSLVHQTSSK